MRGGAAGEAKGIAAALAPSSTDALVAWRKASPTSPPLRDAAQFANKTVQDDHYLIKTMGGASTDAEPIWIVLKAGLPGGESI